MALRFSTALRNAVGSGQSWGEALANGRLYVFSGSQPTDADTTDSGTNLVIFTLSGATYTAPTQCIGKLTLSGTTSGSVDAVTVGGASNSTGYDLLNSASVTHTGTHSTTATAVAADINAKANPFGITAVGSGDDVLLYVPKQLGASFNSVNLYAAATTTTCQVNGGSSNTFAGTGTSQAGVAAANGLNFQKVAAGVLAKETTAWQGVALATGTAGWFRFVAGGHSYTGASTTDIRFDGSIATSGGDLTLSATALTLAATQTINTFSITVPAS